ncbi:hypothetical protein KDW_18010 [Dictyobacter vulcani]|uniref:HTH cro/C1-type domain-containing protein n=1 Tax=Dictyobacter vulcani TaxID=2607529 RepID=A0A5J4KNC4_9CHLR|nr:helix-turn-helix transcriptional regulator [Dictyobacter vulcani]GER87639.1 hypothetical protein KDW_18010 [Dictyobacter vulcani]
MDTRQHGAFHEILKYQREVRGWSQARMAEELGTTPNRISSWERNISFPSAYFRERLCSLLDMDAHELGLLTLTPEPPHPAATSLEDPESEIPTVIINREIMPQQAEVAISQQIITRPPRRRKFWLIALLLCVSLIGASFLIAYTTGFISFGAPNPYVANTGRLVLDDSLQRQDSSINWQEGTNELQANCLFKNGEYVAFQPQTGRFHACMAQKTDYKNFAYEVYMTIRQGDFGGIVFRAENGIDGHYYVFRIHTNGNYWLYRFTDHSIEHAILLDQGNSRNFNGGLNAHNLLAVVAQDDRMAIYINHQQLTSLQDSGYTHGAIGVLAGSLYTGSGEASFKDARVWTWP